GGLLPDHGLAVGVGRTSQERLEDLAFLGGHAVGLRVVEDRSVDLGELAGVVDLADPTPVRASARRPRPANGWPRSPGCLRRSRAGGPRQPTAATTGPLRRRRRRK